MMNLTSIIIAVCIFAVLSFGFISQYKSYNSQSINSTFLAIQSDILIDQTIPMVSEELFGSKEDGEGVSYESFKEEENYFAPIQKLIKRQAREKELNFLVLGDFGSTDSNDPLSDTKTIGELLANKIQNSFVSYDFALSMGDLLHSANTGSMEGQNPSTILEETLKIKELGIDWYSTLGKNDCQNDVSKILSLSQENSHWKQKEPFYSKTFKIGSSRLKAGFVFPNGCELVCLNRSSSECNKETLKRINSYKVHEQVEWLDNVLTKMSNDRMVVWKIVVLHHGIFSAGEGFGDSQTLKEMILPILAKHKVDLVLSGHEHNMQYLRMDMELYENLQKENKAVGANSADQPNDKKEQIEQAVQCPNMFDQEQCVSGEFFHYELTRCGIVKKEDQIAYVQSLYRKDNRHSINIHETKFSRNSLINQHDFMHQFVFGNGQDELNKVCPLKQKESIGKLRYSNSDFGLGDIKIKENRMDISLLSPQNEVLYSVNIFRRHDYNGEL